MKLADQFARLLERPPLLTLRRWWVKCEENHWGFDFLLFRHSPGGHSPVWSLLWNILYMYVRQKNKPYIIHIIQLQLQSNLWSESKIQAKNILKPWLKLGLMPPALVCRNNGVVYWATDCAESSFENDLHWQLCLWLTKNKGGSISC